jgi:membrane protein implicated in regulation of membrane protease activity
MSAVAVLMSLLIVGAAVRQAVRPTLTSSDRLVGAAGVVQSDLNPSGTVQVGGQLWSAHAASAGVGAGEFVRVLARRGLTLEVVPSDEGVSEAASKRKEDDP